MTFRFEMPDLEPSGLSPDDVSEGDKVYAPSTPERIGNDRARPRIRYYEVIAIHSSDDKLLVEWNDHDMWRPETHQFWKKVDTLYADRDRAEELAREVCVDYIRQCYRTKVESSRRNLQKERQKRDENIREVMGEGEDGGDDTEILPCPRCGSLDVGVHARATGHVVAISSYVSCKECGIRTCDHGNRELAIEDWNNTLEEGTEHESQ